MTSPVHSTESILNAALRVRGDVPFACAGGVCGTCRAIDELSAAFASAEAAGVRALLLRGAGRAFCAGRDIFAVDPATLAATWTTS